MSMVECQEGRWVKYYDYDKLKRAYQVLEKAVDKAEDLLPTPEQHQDEEWYAGQKMVMEARAEAKRILEEK